MAPATDRTSYPTGAPATITLTVTNYTDHACFIPYQPPGNRLTITQTNTDGTRMANPAVWIEPSADTTTHDPVLLTPKVAYTYATIHWDQHTCDETCATTAPHQEGPQVPPGQYQLSTTVHIANGGITTTGAVAPGHTSTNPPNWTITVLP
jgi:hypothetical protein